MRSVDSKDVMPASADHWRRAKELFTSLREAGAEERPGLLDSYAPDDPVRVAAERLLTTLERAGGFLAEPKIAPAEMGETGMPERIGPYTPVEFLGEGGFGVVYRARQDAPVEREVAVKVLRSGPHAPQVLARFDQERRFLAMLDHPDIVRVLDAGTAETGQMYVVMDLAPGEPITGFVRSRGLGLRERLALMARVCYAVHAVHQRAVVHRDLKPSNILVSMEAQGPRPRLIDFGIATALDGGVRAGWTVEGAPIGTPRYASPEQASGAEGVDTRTDVYALGMILGEVLTGSTPRKQMTGEESAAVSPSRAAAQAGDVALSRRLRGDVDRIVLKAVAWEASGRYDSAASLAQDIERYLAGEPVQAAAPGRVYAARKFVGRHKVASAAAAVAVCALVGGLGVSLAATREANAQRQISQMNARRAAFIGTFLLGVIERNADPDARGGAMVMDGDSLRTVAAEAMAGLEHDPETMLDLLVAIGQIQFKIGMFDDAKASLSRALEHAADHYGVPSEQVVRLRVMLAKTLEREHARREEAGELVAAAAREAAEIFGPNDPRLLSVLINTPQRLEELERIVGLLEADPSSRPEDVMAGLSSLYWRLEFGPAPSRGLPYVRRWYERSLAHYGPAHSLTVSAMMAYASAESIHGTPERALPLLEEALERSLATFGPDHNQTEAARRVLARVFGEAGMPERGLPHALDHEQQTRRVHGEGSVQHAGALRLLGALRAQAGDLEAARGTLEASLRATLEHWPATHTTVTGLEARLAEVLSRLGAMEEADEIAQRALDVMAPKAMAGPIVMATAARVRVLDSRGEGGAATELLGLTLRRLEEAGAAPQHLEALRGMLAERAR